MCELVKLELFFFGLLSGIAQSRDFPAEKKKQIADCRLIWIDVTLASKRIVLKFPVTVCTAEICL